jgi:ligand-binding sensor domain-containing protein
LHTFAAALLSLCALVFARPGVSQAGINAWTSHGPYGGSVRALAIDPATPSTLYAGTLTGVFQSTNSGGSWSAVKTGLNNFYVYALVIDPTTPSTLYAGTWGGGVYQSTNSGGSWSAVNIGLSGNALCVYALAIDPTTPSTLYAGTYRGVFQSTNSGGSWSAVNTGLPVDDYATASIRGWIPQMLESIGGLSHFFEVGETSAGLAVAWAQSEK